MYTVLIPGRKKEKEKKEDVTIKIIDIIWTKKRAEMVELPPTTMNFLFYAAPAMAYVSLL